MVKLLIGSNNDRRILNFTNQEVFLTELNFVVWCACKCSICKLQENFRCYFVDLKSIRCCIFHFSAFYLLIFQAKSL